MTLACSFCDKSQHAVRTLIAATGVWICDECVDLCATICAERRHDEREARLLKEIMECGT